MQFWERFSSAVTRAVGSTAAFLIALGLILVWAVSGYFCDYNEAWQLIINTGTTIATFLMVFLIQRAQNKDALAQHLKLDELIAASRGSNRLIDVENQAEKELETLRAAFAKLSTAGLEPHSVEEVLGGSGAVRAGAGLVGESDPVPDLPVADDVPKPR